MAKKRKLTSEEKRERVTTTVQQYTADITKAVNKLQNCYTYKDEEKPELRLVTAMLTVVKLAAKLDSSYFRLIRLVRLEKDSLRCARCSKKLQVYHIMSWEKDDCVAVNVARCPKCKTEQILEKNE